MNDMIMWSPGVSLDDIERQVIQKAYQFYQRNKTATAVALGISVRTIDNKLERYALEAKEAEERNADARAARTAHLARARGIHPAQFDTSTGQAPSYEAQVRNGMEPPSHFATQPDMPVQERQEVQGVLPKNAAYGGTGKRRG